MEGRYCTNKSFLFISDYKLIKKILGVDSIFLLDSSYGPCSECCEPFLASSTQNIGEKEK